MPLHKSIADGNWSSPTTWDTGIVPQLTGDTVEIHHRVLYDLNPAVADAMSFAWVKIIGSAQLAELYFYDGSSSLRPSTPVTYVLRVTGSPTEAGIQVIYNTGMVTPKLTVNNNTVANAADRKYINHIKHVGNSTDIFMDIDSRCDVHLEGIDIPDSAEVFSGSSGASSLTVLGAYTGKWKIGDTLYYYRGNHYGVRTIYSTTITGVAAGPNMVGVGATTVISVSPGLSVQIAQGNTVVVMAKSVILSNIISSQCGKINVSTASPSGPSIFQSVQMSKVTLYAGDRGIQFSQVTISEAVDFRATNFRWDTGAVYNSTFYRMVNCWLLNLKIFGKSADSVFRDCVGMEVSGRIFCNYNVFTESDHLTLAADLMFNFYALNECYHVDLHDVYIYGNEVGALEPAHLTIYDSVFGWNRKGADIENYEDIRGDSIAEVVLKNVKPPADGWMITLGTLIHSYGKIGFEDEDGGFGQQRTTMIEGTISKTPAPNVDTLVCRGGGATAALVQPGAVCSRQRPLTVFEYFIETKANIERQFVCYVIAGEAWPTSLRGANASDPAALTEDSTLWLEAEYYNDEGLLTHSRKYSVEQVPNSAVIDNYWTGTPLVVAVTPKRDGVIRIALKLAAYSSGCFVVVDPRIIIS